MVLRLEDLPSDAARLTEMVVSLDAENERLRTIVATFKDMVFGSRSEKAAVVAADQFALDLADVVTDVTPTAANDDEAPSQPVILANKSRNKARRNIGALPKHLPRCEQLIEPETTVCPCCQGSLHRIGQDVSEVLDLIPAILRVLRMIRPKYACRGCDAGSWCSGFYAAIQLNPSAWAPLLTKDGIESGLLLPILFHCVDRNGHPLIPSAPIGDKVDMLRRYPHTAIPAAVELTRQYWMPTRFKTRP